MAQRGRRPSGSPGGREPGRSARSRDPRTRGASGRAQAPRSSSARRTAVGAQARRTTAAGTRRSAARAPATARATGGSGWQERLTGAWHSLSDRSRQGGNGMSPRRVVIVVVMVCFLSLALANPVRTYFTQHHEAAQAAAQHDELVQKIAELQKQRSLLEDPDYIRAQARDRLGFVEAGRTPYIVELPGDAATVQEQHEKAEAQSRPWYGSVWDSVSRDPSDEDVPVPNVIPAPAPAPGG